MMKDLTIGKEGNLIFHFTLPMVLGNLFQQLFNIADTIIVGKFIGKEALAAVGASFPIFYTLIALVIGIGSGGTILISQYFGAKDINKVQRSIETIFILLFAASIIVSFIGFVYAEDIFSLLNTGEDVMPDAIKYFKIYMLGMIAFFGFNGISSVLRGLGDSKTPLYFLVVATLVNILLSIIFVVIFKLGVEGVAYATVIAHFVAFISAYLYLIKINPFFKTLQLFNLQFDKEIFIKSLKIGLPTGLQQTLVALGLLALIRIINNFDTSVLAAFSAASKIDSLASMPALAFASALSAFVGQNIGARKFDRVKKGVYTTLAMSTIFSLIVMIITIIWGDNLMKLFISESESAVILHGENYLTIVSSFYVVFSAMFVLHGAMRGAGDTIFPMIVTLLSMWIIRIPVAVWLSNKYGVEGIWWSIPIGWCAGFIMLFIYYSSGKWKGKEIINPLPSFKIS